SRSILRYQPPSNIAWGEAPPQFTTAELGQGTRNLGASRALFGHRLRSASQPPASAGFTNMWCTAAPPPTSVPFSCYGGSSKPIPTRRRADPLDRRSAHAAHVQTHKFPAITFGCARSWSMLCLAVGHRIFLRNASVLSVERGMIGRSARVG